MTRLISSSKWIALGCIVAAAGCQNPSTTKPADSASVRADVTDIHPMEATTPPAYQPTPVAYQAEPAQPVTYDTTSAAAPTMAATIGSNTHVVKRGETLYSIARQTYGDGKQWKRIASANPGISPTTLKIGQTLTIP